MRRIKYKNKSFSDTEFKDILISDFLYFFPFIAKEDIGFDPSNPDIRYEKGGDINVIGIEGEPKSYKGFNLGDVVDSEEVLKLSGGDNLPEKGGKYILAYIPLDKLKDVTTREYLIEQWESEDENARIDKMIKYVREGNQLPPIPVRQENDGRFYVSDGAHREVVARELDKKYILAWVFVSENPDIRYGKGGEVDSQTKALINLVAKKINGKVLSFNKFITKEEYPELNVRMNIGAGWKGALIKTENNLVGVAIKKLGDRVIIVSKIVIADKGQGLGTDIMNILIDHAKNNNKVIWLEDVVNPKYFKKFGQLEFVSNEGGKKTYELVVDKKSRYENGGEIISGDEVYQSGNKLVSENNDENNGLFPHEKIIKKNKYYLIEIPVNRILELDSDVAKFVEQTKDEVEVGREITSPIIIVENDKLIDGNHRVAQAVKNGDAYIMGYVPVDSILASESKGNPSNPDIRYEKGGVINESNYFRNTKGEFEIINKEEYDSVDVEEFVSESGSRYKTKDGMLYRGADHWGEMKIVRWNLKNKEYVGDSFEGELDSGLDGYDKPIYAKILLRSLSLYKEAVVDEDGLVKVWVSMRADSPSRAGITPFIEVHPSLSIDDVKNVVSGKYPDYAYFKYRGARHA